MTQLTLDDLTAECVLRFLNSLETVRGNHVRSRNQRLTALRTFFEYLGHRLPERLLQAQRVASIPTKRAQPPTTSYLEREEIEALFDALPVKGRHALRDRALLLFLYNTGARVQEVADLRAANFEWTPSPRVRLHGKGDKWRVCPLWPETAALLVRLIPKGAHGTETPVFTAHGRPLTRFGIYKLVRRHTDPLPACHRRAHRISPHVFRHSAATSLLEGGADVNLIRAWLGHVSLETTNRYAEITLRTKIEAVNVCQPPVSASLPVRAAWRTDTGLLHWLQSL